MKKITLALLVIGICSCTSEVSTDGDILFEKGMFAEAIEAYSNYLSTNPDHAKTLYNRGRAYEEVGKAELATSDFQKILSLDPKNINAYLSLAKLSYNSNNYAQVLHFTNKVIELNENSSQGHFLAARAAHQLGFTDQALESYNNAITINKSFGEAFLYRGALKIGLDKKRSACEDFNFARSLGVAGASDALQKYCN